MNYLRLTPINLPEYELLDSGDGEKLERFGKYILRRPEPQAVWQKSLTSKEWEKQCHAYFQRKSERDAESGNWQLKPGMPDRWTVKFKSGSHILSFRLALTSFKHVGLFPEQAENWDFIIRSITALTVAQPKVLNLFAYTGAASVAACAAGAEVTHVDSVKQVISWSRENMESSGLNGIRWVVEDAFKFVQREVRRGNQYHGIILDPPAYGRGPDGEKWYLEKQINELIQLCSNLLHKKDAFFLMNLYSMGFSPFISENLVQQHFKTDLFDSGELYLPDRFGKNLPLGTFLRFNR